MKTGIITASVSRNAGGVFDAVRCLSQALHNPPRVEVHVFGPQDENTHKDLHEWGDLPMHISVVRGPAAFGYSPGLISTLNAAHLDLLHSHGAWMFTSMACSQWSKFNKKPYVVSLHGMLDDWALSNSRWIKLFAGWLFQNRHLRSAACLRALCEAEAQSLRKYGLQNPICVIPNGCDVDGVGLRDKLLPNEKQFKTLLYLGRLHPKKGLMNLLRAWDLARRRGANGIKEWHLVIAGWEEGRYSNTLKALARELGIEGTVRFAGPQFGSDKLAMYANADAFILPSFSEGLPMTVLEAWGYALPVLMTPQCNLPEGFGQGAALKIDPFVDSIARGLETFFSMSTNEQQDLGARGYRLVKERFSWKKIAGDMQKVHEWILGGGNPPQSVWEK